MNETTDAAAIYAPLWKHKWLILAVAILVAAGSYVYYKHQPSLYSATTQVYLGNGAEEQSQISAAGSAAKKVAAPNTETQASLINSSLIKEAVKARLRAEPKSPMVRAALKGKVKSKAVEKSEFIAINGEAHNPRGVALLVNATAQAYIKRQNAHFRREVESAIALTRRQVRRIEAGQVQKGKDASKNSSSATATLQSATLSTKINQLESDLAVSEVTQIDPAKGKLAKLLSPYPKSNAIFGFVIGLVLAAFAAYALSFLDRRLRSLAAIEEVFQTQVLSALRAVRRPIVNRDGCPVPASALREGIWRLGTRLQVANAQEPDREHDPRVILCISADAGDGKSTLLAALALAWGQAGERVAIVEADFRRPVQAKLLGLEDARGLADVLNGRLTAEEAMQTVSLASLTPEVDAETETVPVSDTGSVAESRGTVCALTGTTDVSNPPALLARPAMAELLGSLSQKFDYVLIDAPPPLQVSDVLPLLGAVDGIVIVARIGHTSERSAARLVQLLKNTNSAPVLGVVANAVSLGDVKKYGFYSAQYKRGWRQSLSRG